MAAITVTSLNVRPANAHQCILRPLQAGAACTVGYAIYLDSSGYMQHADANAGETEASGVGIIVESYDGETSIASGKRGSVCILGPVEGFSGMTPNEPIYVSTTAGRLDQTAPTGGAYQRAIGWALSATCIFVNADPTDPESVS